MKENLKALVVYYSLDGNTRMIAKEIAGESGAELLELKPEKEIKAKGFMKFFWGGRQAIMKQEPTLLPSDKNPPDYELIFIGTPVWAGTFTPPLRTFFRNYPLQGKKIALFCCHLGGKGKTLEKMKTVLSGNQILGETDFLEPSRTPEKSKQAAKEWASRIVAGL